MTPIDVFREATEHSLMLSSNGNKLRVMPAKRLTPDFAETLKAHKRGLLTMLQLPFVMVDSQALDEIVYFCADEQTKASLVEAGASEWSIYTRAELKILVENNRIAPISESELCKIHEIKKTFNARIEQ